MGSALSVLHEQEMGVPHGSILSPALFSIKINNIVKAVLKGTDCSLFVDDFALCMRGKTLNRVERPMQLCVNNVQHKVSQNGFTFSTSKTVCIHFHQQYGFFPEPNIFLGKTPMCGADRNVLLRLYHALVRSKLDYRSALSMDRPVGQFYGI